MNILFFNNSSNDPQFMLTILGYLGSLYSYSKKFHRKSIHIKPNDLFKFYQGIKFADFIKLSLVFDQCVWVCD